MEIIKSTLLENFKKNLNGLKRKQSKFAYGITISSYHPFMSESFFDSGITFQPVGKTDTDAPLLISKAPRILKETMEFLFNISIQEVNLQLLGGFNGSCYFEDESSNKIKINFKLEALLGDSNRDCFFIELPESDFDFGATESIFNQLLEKVSNISRKKKKGEGSAWVHNPYISETYNFESTFSLEAMNPHKTDIMSGVNGLDLIEDINLEYRTFENDQDSAYEISRSKSPVLEIKVLREFKINKYITLKLLDNGIFGKSTRIFVNNTPFLQCAYILLYSPQNNPLQSEIDSIDEASEKLDSRLELFLDPPSTISHESMFWAHSSNLQAWYELGYDSRILHSNLSFPLLKKLVDVGDPQAKKMFNEEIAKRILGQYPPVTIYLLKEQYLDYLNDSEIEYIFHKLSEQIIIPDSEFLDEKFASTLLKIGTSFLKKDLYAGHLAIDLYNKLRNLLNNKYRNE